MRQTFVGLLTFSPLFLLITSKRWFLNPRLARDCHQGVDIFSVFPSWGQNLHLNNTGEKQQVCFREYTMMVWSREDCFVCVLLLGIHYVCMYILCSGNNRQGSLQYINTHHQGCADTLRFSLMPSTKERCIALQGKHICLFGCNQISLPEIILFSVTSN